MKRYISKLYLLCIAIGFLVLLIGSTFQNNNNVGNLWTQAPENITPDQVIQRSSNMREYHFLASDFKPGKNCLLFYTAHTNVKAYTDLIAEERLIYEFSSTKTVFGKTNGAQYHFVELPPDTKNLIIMVDAIYDEFSREEITYMQCDDIYAYRELMKNSLAESLISSFIMLLGSCLMLYWVFYCRKINVDTSVVYFGCFATLLGAWTFNETTMSTLMISNRTMASLMGFMLLFMVMQPMILFTSSFLKVKKKLFTNLYCLLVTISMFVCLTLHLSGIKEMRELVYVIHIMLFVGMAYMLYCMIYHIVHYGFSRRVIVNLVGVSILLISSLVELAAYYADNRVNDVVGRAGMLLYIAIVATEVMHEFTTQVQENRKAMYYKELAMIDTLTGFQNRNAFENWEHALTKYDDITLVTFDLNNLKLCNDTKGHLMGDQYIIDAARIIGDVFGKIGTCYRIGGDEFLTVIKNSKGIAIEKYINQLRKQEADYNKQSKDIEMMIACGYATYIKKDKCLQHIRNRADTYMYENKTKLKQQNAETLHS